MHSNNITNNYDSIPLLSSTDNNRKSNISLNSKSWLKRMFNTTPFFERNLSTIRSTGKSGNDSNCQWNNSFGEQYGANGGYAYDRMDSTEKMDVSEHPTRSIRIYWRVM
ncbi:hypothetical protein ACH3XW_25210 [Acanthocheilonema viteae]